VRTYFQYAHKDCYVDSSLDFDNSTTWCLQMAGRKDAQTILDIGPESVHKTLAEWYDD